LISPEEAMNIAEYYQAAQDWGKAGEFYALCAQYHKALKLFLQCGESEMDKVSGLLIDCTIKRWTRCALS
jgi:WD repeat-containing protein 19